MSRWGKIFWLVAGLSIAIMLSTRFILGAWMPFMWVFFGLFVGTLAGALFVDFRFYLEFFTLRTTKHGMNMGVMILLVFGILVSVNFLSLQKNKTWDLTEEGLFTLADQSRDLLRGLNDDIQIKIFYRGAKDKDIKQKLMGAFELYQEFSGKVKVQFIDAYVENMLAQEYLKGLSENEQAVVFVEYKGRKVRVEQPFDEEKITAAMIRATRDTTRTIYFLTGHGELDLDATGDEGLSTLKKGLTDSGFKVSKMNLLENPEIPGDADVVAIIGPKNQIFEAEINKLRDFARQGGKLFIAADPGQKHQLSLLVRSFGLEFKNNFVINDALQLMGRGAAGALGMVFDRGSDITKKFRTREDFTLFDLATEVTKAVDAPLELSYVELVKTPPNSFSVAELGKEAKGSERRPHTLAMSVAGKLPGAGEAPKAAEFAAVVFGDSDFLSQKDIMQGLNLDLALNSISFLVKETDLISIRPKQPAGTKIALSGTTWGLTVMAGVLLPLALLISGGVFWFRRRSA